MTKDNYGNHTKTVVPKTECVFARVFVRNTSSQPQTLDKCWGWNTECCFSRSSR